MLTEEQEKEGQQPENQDINDESAGQGSFMDDVWNSAVDNSYGLIDDAEREEAEKEQSEQAEESEAEDQKEAKEEDAENQNEDKKKKPSDAKKKKAKKGEVEQEENQEGEEGEEGEGNEEEGKDSDAEDQDKDDENEIPENYKELMQTIQDIDPEAKIETTDDLIKYSKKIGEDYSTLKKENEENQKIYQEFLEVMENDPVSANFMNDLKNGASFEEAVMLNVDPENIEFDENLDTEKLKERKQERQEQYKAMKERQNEIEQNKDVSVQNIESFAKENEYDRKQMASFIDNIQNFMNDYDKGLISKEFLQVLDRAMNADAMADKKAEAARIAARNEKLAADAMKKKKKQKGDGIPHLKGNNKVNEETKRDVDDWTKSIDEYEQSRTRL